MSAQAWGDVVGVVLAVLLLGFLLASLLRAGGSR